MPDHRHILLRIFALFTATLLVVAGMQLVIGPNLSNVGRALLLIGTCAAAFAVCGLYSLVLSRRLQQQVDDLDSALERISRGEFNQPIPSGNALPLKKVVDHLGNVQLLIREREQQLREHADRIHTVLDSMVEGVIALDARQRVMFINDAAASMLTITTQSVVGRQLLELARLPEIERMVSEVYRSGEVQKADCETIRGARRILSMRCTPTKSESVQGAVLVIRDITELRSLENMRRDFVTNVSHELKTPLASITAYAETLRLGGIEDVENRMRFVERIEEQATRLNQLILDLIQLARIESGKKTYDITSVDVGKVAARRVEAFAEDARDRGIELSFKKGDQSLEAKADEEAIGTILDNLITNAIRYTPEKGTVEVCCCRHDRKISMTITDTGLGIAPDQKERIFERFFRVDKARSSDLGGTGLGLSIVKHLVQSMGGTVNVESKIGHGSKFVVTLPTTESSENIESNSIMQPRLPGSLQP